MSPEKYEEMWERAHDFPETKEEWAMVVAGLVASRYPEDYKRIDGVLTYVPPTTTRPAADLSALLRGKQ